MPAIEESIVTVRIQDKRRQKQSVSGLDLANGTWFALLDIPGMSDLINTQHTNDEINATPATAKKMAALIAGWTPPQDWASSMKSVQLIMKLSILEFLLTCNGFRTS